MLSRLVSLLGFRAGPSIHLDQARSLRSKIKISKVKFEVSMDLHQFNRDEIVVKARPEYLIIQGKQERPTPDGYVIRKFIKKIKLPPGCDPCKMKSKISDKGLLTVTALRDPNPLRIPCETRVPIKFKDPIERYSMSGPSESIMPIGDCGNDKKKPSSEVKPVAKTAAKPNSPAKGSSQSKKSNKKK